MKITKINNKLMVVALAFFSAGTHATTDAITAQEQRWRAKIVSQVEQHPAMAAQRQTMAAKNSQAQALKQALYNPQLSSGLEREGSDTNYNVGISQTIDWWDKSSVRTKNAGFDVIAATEQYRGAFQTRLSDLLKTIVEYNAAIARYRHSQEQEQRINLLIEQIENRQSVGDLGPLDSQLALFSLSQKYNQTAKTITNFERTKMKARQLMPTLPDDVINIPASFWHRIKVFEPSRDVSLHPLVLAATAHWNSMRQQARLAKLEAKADPTFGVSAGKSGGENTIGLNFSMALNVRNSFSDRVKAANQAALAVEAELAAITRTQKYKQQAAINIARHYQQRVEQGQMLMLSDRESSISLLEAQWRSGDINTADHLIAMQQIADGWIAGIDMQQAYQIAMIDLLEQSGQLIEFLGAPTLAAPIQ